MSKIKGNVTIRADYICPNTEEPHGLDVSPSDLSCHVLSSIYDDCDNGFEIEYTFHCPKCGQQHTIEIAKDTPFGCRDF